MTAATDLDKVAADLFIWQAYDPAVKADLFSSAIVTADGIFVVDPIPLRKAPLAQLHDQGVIAGVIVTNANHLRASSQFAELYNEHSRAIYYLALRLLSDPQKAEDATHDVFLKAFRHMGQFRGESSWRTWLYRIAINHCRNVQRAWHDRHILSNAEDAVWETAAANLPTSMERNARRCVTSS